MAASLLTRRFCCFRLPEGNESHEAPKRILDRLCTFCGSNRLALLQVSSSLCQLSTVQRFSVSKHVLTLASAADMFHYGRRARGRITDSD